MNVIISSLVSAMFLAVAYVCSKKSATCRYVISVMVLFVEATLVQALCSDASGLCCEGKADFFLKKGKRHIASSSRIHFVSHANLKLHKNKG